VRKDYLSWLRFQEIKAVKPQKVVHLPLVERLMLALHVRREGSRFEGLPKTA
jgi:hypothetical protein